MPAKTPCSLLIDPPAPGDWNMAVDEALLESLGEQGACGWRFYEWREPTLSLGYFQACDDRRRHPASLHCPLVRRASGGGAILHDVELTYSLVVAADTELALQRERLYRTVHETLIDALAQLGVNGASLFGKARRDSPSRQPFLCFQRRAPGDVIYGVTKIAGSAQRRRRGAVLQHGSILLAQSDAAPELPGIKELTEKEFAADALRNAWLPRLEDHLGLDFSNRSLTSEEQHRAEELVQSKYGNDAWNRDRNAPAG
jgi:lipoate-protein ligase A